MSVWAITRKSLRELVREPLILLATILTPAFFLWMGAMWYAAPRLTTHSVLVMNRDSRGQPLVQAIEAERYADGRPAFNIAPTDDERAAEQALKDKRAAVLVTLQPDDAGQLHITVRGDATSMAFTKASVLLDTVIARHLKREAGVTDRVRFDTRSLAPVGPETDFDLYTPGMIAIAILLNAMLAAMLMAREVRWGTMRRLQLTRIRPWELLAGVSAAQMILAAVEIALVFLCALALGFHNHGSLALAFGLGLILSFSAVSLGMLTACFVNDDSQAINLAGTAAMLQVFLAGCMFPLPPFTVFRLAGHEVGLFDIFPATHLALAMQQVMCYGAGLREIGFQLVMAVALSALYFAAGVILFGRLQMRESR